MANDEAINGLRERLQAFLAAHNTMTLATLGPDGAPQAAAVFFAADDDLNLYFLSSPNSRHSQNLSRQPRVAATVHADGQAWQAIQGLQIEGIARQVEGPRSTAHAARVYAGRFAFLKGLLDGGAADGPLALRGPVASSRFYVLQPTWIRFIDNTRGFGHREEYGMWNVER
jgi:uncharacterized protein YhbP (UPF0306 family)